MNLKDLRQRIFNYSDFSPDNLDYRRQVDDVINDAYNRVWTSKQWTFSVKDTWLDVLPDLNTDRTAATASYTDGQRLVTFNTGVFVLETRSDHYEGNIIQLQNREYEICQILNSGSLTTTEPIRLTGGTGSISTDTDWQIKSRFYRLPQDCMEILSLAQRDVPMGSTRNVPPYGKTRALNFRTEAEMGLRIDETNSWAEYYVPVAPTQVPSALKLSASWTEHQSGLGNGDIPPNRYMELAWAFVGPDGALGPLSEPLFTQAEGTEGNVMSAELTFLTFDDQFVSSSNTLYNAGPGTRRFFEGYRKRLFYNSNLNPLTGERLGNECWQQCVKEVNTDGAAPLNLASRNDPLEAEDTEATLSLTNIQSLAPGSPRWSDQDPIYSRIRPYPRIDAWDQQYLYVDTNVVVPDRDADYFRRMQLIYYFRPERLVLDTDTPQMPTEFHHIIFETAMADILYKSGDTTTARDYEVRAERRLNELAKRYTNRDDNDWRLGQFGTGEIGLQYAFDRNSLRKIR